MKIMFVLARADAVLRGLLILFLLGIVIASGRANIQTDAIDYYAIVQRLTGDAEPIVPSLPFVEQRSPGYPLLSLPVYYALHFLVVPWVTPQTINPAPPPPAADAAPRPSERALLPPQPLAVKDIFFKNFSLAPQGSWFRWDIIAAMLLTGYGLFFAGLFVSGKTLALLYPQPVGFSLPPLMVLASAVFMHNLVNTPAYATLAVFGVSCLFTWFWVRGWQSGAPRVQWAAGLLAGLLVLIRLETALIVVVLAVALALRREFRFLRTFFLGGLLPLALLLLYNAVQFGNPLHAGILKGDMSILTFIPSYALATLVEPRSGIVLWSALTSLGIIGLFFSPWPALRYLGWAALALIALIALRVPVMYACVGQGTLVVSGATLTCPSDASAMLDLIRTDANRYVVPLVPFAALGARGLLEQLPHLFRRHP